MSTFGADITKTVVPVIQTIVYSAGACMGGLQTVPVFRGSDITQGIFNNFFILSKCGNTGGITIYLFDTKPTASTVTDATAFSLSTSDMAKIAFNPFTVTPAVPQNGTAAMGEYAAVRSVQNGDSPTTVNLYMAIIANATITPSTTSDLIYSFNLSQD